MVSIKRVWRKWVITSFFPTVVGPCLKKISYKIAHEDLMYLGATVTKKIRFIERYMTFSPFYLSQGFALSIKLSLFFPSDGITSRHCVKLGLLEIRMSFVI